jgi:hypothetical protein
MTDFEKTLELLDAADQRNRDEARRTTQASPQPATPEQRQQDAARWLANKLQANASQWTTVKP